MKSASREPAQIRLTVHLETPRAHTREELEARLGDVRDELRTWLFKLDPAASVLPDRNALSASSIAYIVTSSRMAALRTRLLPLTWSSLVTKVETAKPHGPIGVGDVIEPLRK